MPEPVLTLFQEILQTFEKAPLLESLLTVTATAAVLLASNHIPDFLKSRAAAAEFEALKYEVSKHKAIDLDIAIEICKSLARIEALYGETHSIPILIKDSLGNPAHLTLTAN